MQQADLFALPDGGASSPAEGMAAGPGTPSTFPRTDPDGRQDHRTGLDLKRDGQETALAGEDLWRFDVLETLKNWAFGKPPFRFEEFRDWWTSGGGSQPRSHKAWGAITTAAAKAGYIKWTGGYAPARSAKTHGHPVKVWKSA